MKQTLKYDQIEILVNNSLTVIVFSNPSSEISQNDDADKVEYVRIKNNGLHYYKYTYIPIYHYMYRDYKTIIDKITPQDFAFALGIAVEGISKCVPDTETGGEGR